MRLALLTLIFLSFNILIECSRHREYYDLLDVTPKASENEIKKAYRKLSQKYHPDKNPGDDKAQDMFVKIATAYEVLSDTEKRRKYDQYGPDFEKQEQQQNYNPWGDWFGGGQQREKKGPELPIKIPVTLEDIYNGKEIDIFHTKQVVCPHCRGSGADDPDDVETCPVCRGQGYTLKKQQIAPGFYQQFQATCDRCDGKGKVFSSVCHVCGGTKTISGMDTFTLFIEKGVKNGHPLRFANMGNEFHDQAASDIVFIVIETPHPRFKREGDNLRIIIDLTLKEALLGFEKKIKHLDGHEVKISRDYVTQPGDVDKISGEGMPQHEYSSFRGDLFVEYRVNFPTQITPEQAKLWEEFFWNK